MDERNWQDLHKLMDLVISLKVMDLADAAKLDPNQRSARWAEGPLTDIRLALEVKQLLRGPTGTVVIHNHAVDADEAARVVQQITEQMEKCR